MYLYVYTSSSTFLVNENITWKEKKFISRANGKILSPCITCIKNACGLCHEQGFSKAESRVTVQ